MTVEQQLAIYRRNHKRRLRQTKAKALEVLGLMPHDPPILLLWDCQLNYEAAWIMLKLLRELQVELPEIHDRIENCLKELGISEEEPQDEGGQ